MNIRKVTTRPGFELIFAAGIAAIFIVPSAVMAQNTKNIEISIMNGDTVINGKHIKDLTPEQRKDAMADLQKITGPKGKFKEFRLDRKMNGDIKIDGRDLGNSNLDIQKTPDGFIVQDNRDRPVHLKRIMKDTASLTYSFRLDDGKMSMSMPPPPPGDGRRRDIIIDRLDEARDLPFKGRFYSGTRYGMRRNSQTFNYSNTDGQGISTRVNFRVTETEGEEMPSMSGTEKPTLAITDLKLVPDFTSGKTLLMFDLPTKAAAEVELTDGSGKVLWAEKSTGETFSKSFPLPLNGIYHLKVKQGGKIATKQIMKEE